MLGEFEYLLLTAAARLGENAYGAAIREEIEAATGKSCSIGALYTTLDRLEAKGLVQTWMGEATAQRGGSAAGFPVDRVRRSVSRQTEAHAGPRRTPALQTARRWRTSCPRSETGCG